MTLYSRMVRFGNIDAEYKEYEEIILPERVPDELYFDD